MLLHRNTACFSTDCAGVSQGTVCRLSSFLTLTTQTAAPLARDATDSFVVTVWQESMWDYASNPFDGDDSYFTRAGDAKDESQFHESYKH